jgi:predicted transcriptional regulator
MSNGKRAKKPAKAHKITISLSADALANVDALAKADHRTRSGMISFFLAKMVAPGATTTDK